MDSFAHAIHQLQSGALQHPEFLAQLDRVLENAPESASRLLELLSEEHARTPLPREVYTEVQHRIGRLIAARQHLGGDDTYVQTKPGSQPAAAAPPGPARPPAPRADEDAADAEPERMKGVGETLNGRFVLEECLGFGGMGTVYKALDLRKLEAADRKPYIAIKVLNVQFRGHPKSLIALQREARKAQALAHPNIVSVYDFDRDGPMVYLTMEYLQGKPLSQLLRAPGFAGMPYAEVLPIVTGMANALAYAHGRGFVHCDFKPGNVILTDAGQVKVIDFGIARVFQKTEDDVDVTVFDPGSLGALTPAYASPEMLENREPDPRDDIYALACITYELLTGHHPFNRLSSAQARAAAMKPQRPPALGRSQWQALKCGLALERETRTPTAERFLAEFSASGLKSRAGQAAAAGAAAVVVLALAGWYFLGRQGPAPDAAAPETQAQAPAPVAPQAQPAAQPEALPDTPAPAAQAAPTAAAVTAALARIPCSALLAEVRSDTVEVRGFVSKAAGAAAVKESLAAMPGVGAVELDEVREVEPDKCPVITTFAPYWIAHRQAGGGAALRLAGSTAAEPVLVEGDSLMVDVTTPAGESFINVDSYSLEGNVVHLLPNPRARDNRAPPNFTATIGSLGEWGIGPPFGTEMVVLLTTPVPLFDAPRPVSEPSAGYLLEVSKRLEQIGARNGAGSVGVEFLQIATRARGR